MGTIAEYPPPRRALAGDEPIPAWQDGRQVATSVGQLSDFVAKAATAEARDAAAAASLSASAAAGFLAGILYPSTAAGLAATAEGGYFTVAGDGTTTYAILYREVAGVAVEQARYASKAAYEGPAGATLLGYRTRSDAVTMTVAARLRGLGLTSADFGAVGDGVVDDTAALQKLLMAGDGRVLCGSYRLTQPLTVPIGRHLIVEAGTAFLYEGADGDVFQITDGVQLVCAGPEGAEWEVRCAKPRPFVWAVGTVRVNGLRVVGLRSIDCSHVRIGGEKPWAQYVTPAMKAAGDSRTLNVSFDVRIYGGGARYSKAPGSDITGACFLGYVFGATVQGATYERCSHGIQFWGGNASNNYDGAVANERKCQDLLITGCQAYDCSGGGIWGAMGRDVLISYCKAARCGDLGFDVEGCDNVAFVGCMGQDSENGQFNTYSLNRGILWEGCVAVTSDRRKPLFNVYNESLSQENNDLTWRGGRLECTDTSGPGVVAAVLGNARHLTFEPARMVNVRFEASALNSGNVTFRPSAMAFPYPAAAAFDAVYISLCQNGQGQVRARIGDLRIDPETAAQPAGTRLLHVVGKDNNVPPSAEIRNVNGFLPLASGGFAPVVLANNGTKVGRFLIAGCILEGPIQLSDTVTPGQYTIPAGSNLSQTGDAVPVVYLSQGT